MHADFAGSDCVDAVCAKCPDVVIANDCCSGSSPSNLNCFKDALRISVTSSSLTQAASSPTPTPPPDPNVLACPSTAKIFNACEASTTSFHQLKDSAQASCLCYTTTRSSTLWTPMRLDGLLDGCMSYYQTKNVTAAERLATATVLCESVENVRHVNANITGPTATPVIPSNPITPPSTGTGYSDKLLYDARMDLSIWLGLSFLIILFV